MPIEVVEARFADREAGFAVRREVFVGEQGVPHHVEVDGFDDDCVHLLGRFDGKVFGTLRLRPLGEGRCKVERVAVLAIGRGQGWGRALMDAAEAVAARNGWTDLELHAQLAVVPFYERLGWLGDGPVFFEGGIAHRHFAKRIG